MSNREVELIVRGVLCAEGHVLLCHTKGADNTYLPGGHIEFGEGARDSLRREIEEELGVQAQVSDFLGAVEHQFVQKGALHCEVNLVFCFTCDALTPEVVPPSREEYIEFSWAPIGELAGCALEPAPLRELIPQWVLAPGAARPRFGSTF